MEHIQKLEEVCTNLKSIQQDLDTYIHHKRENITKEKLQLEKDFELYKTKLSQEKDLYSKNVEKEILQLTIKRDNLNREIESMSKMNYKQHGKIKLDIGGCRYNTTVSTLVKYPDSYFGAMFSGRYKIEKDEDGCVFIDRDGTYFKYVLEFLREDEDWEAPTDKDVIKKLKKEFLFYSLPLPSIAEEIKIRKMNRNMNWDTVSSLRILGGTWGNVVLDFKEHCIYWEIKVIKHGGCGHLRVGIVNDDFNIDTYPGHGNNSLSIFPTNRIQGFKNNKNNFNGRDWNLGDLIGVYFNRKSEKVRFYQNKQFIEEITNIPNAYFWYPILCVHCSNDEMELVRNAVIPDDITDSNITKF